MNNYTKRIIHIDLDHSQKVLAYFEQQVLESLRLIENEPNTLPERRYASLAAAYRDIAFLKYAIGFPLREVTDSICLAVVAYEKIFELRATDPAFPASILICDPRLPPRRQRSASKIEPMHPPEFKDYSLGNSRTAYDVVCLAKIANQPEHGHRIALLAWDPPNAAYVGLGSDASCSVNDQRLAYALREFYNGDRIAALAFVNAIGPTRGESRDVVDQAQMLKGLLLREPTRFLIGLSNQLDWHRQAAQREPKWDVDYFICWHGLGLTSLALENHLVQEDQLPQDDAFLPLGLLRYNS